MSQSVFKTPQMHIVGKLAYAENFDCDGLYAKFNFKAGANSDGKRFSLITKITNSNPRPPNLTPLKLKKVI